jgi:hypothetical protein
MAIEQDEFVERLIAGRRDEHAITFLLQKRQYLVTPLAEIENGSAPRALGPFGTAIVLPDLQVSKSGWTGAVEVKGKGEATFTYVTQQYEHGVGLRLYKYYRQYQQATGIRVILMIREKSTNEIIARSLDGLGEPRIYLGESMPRGEQMAFWPRKKFTTFHVGPSDFGLFKGMILPPTLPPFDFDCGDEYERWLKDHPAPDLHELIRRYGSYSQIPSEAWAEFERAMNEWDEQRKSRM